MSKKYENRYWEVDEYKGMITGKLHFMRYCHKSIIILQFQQDKDDKELFWYVSDFLNVEQDCISADTPDEAMEEFEDMIVNYIDDQITDLEDLKDKFNEVSL